MDTAVKKENIEQELILQMLDRGIDDIQEGRVYKIDEAFEYTRVRPHEHNMNKINSIVRQFERVDPRTRRKIK